LGRSLPANLRKIDDGRGDDERSAAFRADGHRGERESRRGRPPRRAHLAWAPTLPDFTNASDIAVKTHRQIRATASAEQRAPAAPSSWR